MINYSNFNDIFNKNVDVFFKSGGDDHWLYNFELNDESVVFDLGGFEGEYYSKIQQLYDSKIHVFEPVKLFFDKLPKGNKITLNNSALSKESGEFKIYLNGNCSTSFSENSNLEYCKKESIENYLRENNIGNIDLIKINIEGAEYEVLESLIELNYIKNIKYILVQFHNLSENPIERRENIINILSKTHSLRFEFPFVWECYELKS